jgi:hypothetical protein
MLLFLLPVGSWNEMFSEIRVCTPIVCWTILLDDTKFRSIAYFTPNCSNWLGTITRYHAFTAGLLHPKLTDCLDCPESWWWCTTRGVFSRLFRYEYFSLSLFHVICLDSVSLNYHVVEHVKAVGGFVVTFACSYLSCWSYSGAQWNGNPHPIPSVARGCFPFLSQLICH